MQADAGKFIVLDGPEGGGKSTQLRLLAEAMQAAGRDVVCVRDPGATRVGERVREILLDPIHTEMGMRCEMLLYMAARAQLLFQNVLPALRAGKTVLCDRFVSSTLSYQLGGQGLTADDIRQVAEVAIEGRWPDLTIILDVPVEVSNSRIRRERDRIEQRPTEYHQRVRENFLALARSDSRCRVVDARGELQGVHKAILALAMGA